MDEKLIEQEFKKTTMGIYLSRSLGDAGVNNNVYYEYLEIFISGYMSAINTPKHETVEEIESDGEWHKLNVVESFCDYYEDAEDSTYYDAECGRKTIDVCDIRNWKYCPSCSREIVVRDHHGKPEELIK